MIFKCPGSTGAEVFSVTHCCCKYEDVIPCMQILPGRVAHITYVDAAYCYRPSSMVCRSVYCLSVCVTSEPCKNSWTDRDAIWVVGSDGPKESRVRWGLEVLRDVAIATNFWLSMGYNFGCMIASDTLLDSNGRFSGSCYPTKTYLRSTV